MAKRGTWRLLGARQLRSSCPHKRTGANGQEHASGIVHLIVSFHSSLLFTTHPLHLHVCCACLPLLPHRGVVLFRQWLEKLAGGYHNIPWSGGVSTLPPLETKKEVLLDRLNQHTRQCPSCMKVGVRCTLMQPALMRSLTPLAKH